MGISVATSATSSSYKRLTVLLEVRKQITRRCVVNLRSHRHLYLFGRSLTAGSFRSLAMPTALRDVFRVETKVKKRIKGVVGNYHDVSALSSVTASRPSPGDKLLTAKGGNSIAAVSTFDANYRLVDKQFE